MFYCLSFNKLTWMQPNNFSCLVCSGMALVHDFARIRASMNLCLLRLELAGIVRARIAYIDRSGRSGLLHVRRGMDVQKLMQCDQQVIKLLQSG